MKTIKPGYVYNSELKRPVLVLNVLSNVQLAVVPLCRAKVPGSYRVPITFSNNNEQLSYACTNEARVLNLGQIGAEIGDTTCEAFEAVKQGVSDVFATM